jgi:hypothetical protein
MVFSVALPSRVAAQHGHWYAWDDAHEQAETAYYAWCDQPGRAAFAVYRAAQDRADAAQDGLARRVELAGNRQQPRPSGP